MPNASCWLSVVMLTRGSRVIGIQRTTGASPGASKAAVVGVALPVIAAGMVAMPVGAGGRTSPSPVAPGNRSTCTSRTSNDQPRRTASSTSAVE